MGVSKGSEAPHEGAAPPARRPEQRSLGTPSGTGCSRLGVRFVSSGSEFTQEATLKGRQDPAASPESEPGPRPDPNSLPLATDGWSKATTSGATRGSCGTSGGETHLAPTCTTPLRPTHRVWRGQSGEELHRPMRTPPQPCTPRSGFTRDFMYGLFPTHVDHGRPTLHMYRGLHQGPSYFSDVTIIVVASLAKYKPSLSPSLLPPVLIIVVVAPM